MTCDYFLGQLPGLKACVPRLIAAQSWSDLLRLKRFFHDDDKSVMFGVHELVTARDYYPMPDKIFEAIRKRVVETNASEKRAVVIGLDGYTSLLNDTIKAQCNDELRNFLDEKVHNALFLVLARDLPGLHQTLENPRYKSGQQYIVIDGDQPDTADIESTVYLVREDLFDVLPPDVKSFQEFLKSYEELPSSANKIKIAVPQTIDGLRSGVRQIANKHDYLKFFYSLDCARFTESAVDWIFDKVRGRACNNAVKIIGECFAFDGNMPRNSLRVYALSLETEREVLQWYLSVHAPEKSYLKRSLDAWTPGEAAENGSFIERYVTAAAEMLDAPDAVSLAEERRAALQEAGKSVFEAFIPRFIEACKNASAEKAAIWFNTGTSAEKNELLRRFAAGVSSDGQRAIENVYPALKAYLSENAVYGDAALASYFREYRRQKITGRLSDSFCNRAFAESPPESVKYRDAVLQDFRVNEQTALLVVDAMGAEYLPMITTLARERGIKVEFSQIALAQLPTVTEFNSVEWLAKRTLQPIKALDTICHNGAEMHVNLSPEDNLRAELDVVSDQVMNAIGAGLAKHSRVLLTADHGSSRLAILAQEQNMAQTLPVPNGVKVIGWRYAEIENHSSAVPDKTELTIDGKYLLLRGYNRFSKQGRSTFETHGGAALEERLVPVAVFAQGQAASAESVVKTPEAELVENDDFDL